MPQRANTKFNRENFDDFTKQSNDPVDQIERIARRQAEVRRARSIASLTGMLLGTVLVGVGSAFLWSWAASAVIIGLLVYVVAVLIDLR